MHQNPAYWHIKLAVFTRTGGGALVLFDAVKADHEVSIVRCASRETRKDIALSPEDVSPWRD